MFNHIIRCTPSCFTTNSLSSVTEALVQELYSSCTEYMSYDLWFISLIYHFVSDRNKHQYSSKLHLFSFSSQIIFSWPSWDNLFLASNKMGPYFKSVPLFPSSPASYPLSLQQDLAYQWRISSFNKSLLLQSPFPLVFPAWLVDLTQLLLAGVFGVRVWSRLLGWMDSRSKITKDVLSHYGLRKCMQQHVWVMVCKDVYVHRHTLEVNGLFLHAGRRECINAVLYTSIHPQVGLRLSLYACDQNNKLLKRCPKPASLLFLYHRLPLTLVGHGKK